MSKLHALIIDDNPNNIEVLAMLLTQENATYSAVHSLWHIEQTLDQVGSPDIIFLDLEFPNGDGFGLLKDLKADARFNRIPIVAYSVHTGEFDRIREAGFDSFIGKPVNLQNFPDQLRRILDGEAVWEF
jgi:two-component system, cell cycle response regulator DivK